MIVVLFRQLRMYADSIIVYSLSSDVYSISRHREKMMAPRASLLIVATVCLREDNGRLVATVCSRIHE